MVLKADQERVKTLLKDTITLLCKNGLSFKTKFNVQALIGVTLDDSDVFLVDINEIVRSEKAAAGEASGRDDSSSDEEYVKSRKPSIKGRRSRSPQDDRQNKRAKIVNQTMQQQQQQQQQAMQAQHKRDLHTSEEEEEDEEEEERMMAMNMEHGMMMPKPEDMWDEDEEDEEDPDSLSGSFDDSNSQFPPEVMHNRMPPQHLHQQHLQHHRFQQQHRQQQQQQQQQQHHEDHPEHHHQQPHHPHHHQQQQQKQQQQHHYMKAESSQESLKGLDDNNGDIVYIKEEPEDWPEPGEEEEPPEDANMHPDSMYQSLVNPAAADTSSDDHNFSSLGWQNTPAPRPYRPRTSRTATVTSDVTSQGGAMAGAMEHNPDTQQVTPDDKSTIKEERPETNTLDLNTTPVKIIEPTTSLQDEISTSLKTDQSSMPPISSESLLLRMEKSVNSMLPPSNSKQTLWMCDTCNKTFSRKDSFERHKANVHGSKTWKCGLCDKSFGTQVALKCHSETHVAGSYSCSLCEKTFKYKRSLRQHEMVHRTPEESKYTCQYCNRGFNHKETFEGHLNSHTGARPFQCKRCSSEFMRKSALTHHMQICGVSVNQFQCNSCHKNFKCYRYLKEHERTHKTPKRFQCMSCNEMFDHRISLSRHIMKKHKPE